MTSIISELIVYPLKSAQGVRLDQAQLTPLGFELDRKFMLVDSSNKFISQRQFPLMALLNVEIKEDRLIVSYPSKPYLEIGLNPRVLSEPFTATMHIKKKGEGAEKIQVVDIGGEKVASWFSDVLQSGNKGPLKLVMRDPNYMRLVIDEQDYLSGRQESTNLADGYPYLVVERNDFELVNYELRSRGQADLSVPRIRPNIVTEGLEAWSIMSGGSIVSDGAKLDLVKPCGRCVIIRTNQETGERDIGTEVLSEILPKINREQIDLDKACFGQNTVWVRESVASLAAGHEVKFLRNSM